MAACLADAGDLADGQQINESGYGCAVARNGKLAIGLANVRGHLGKQSVWSNTA